jgi:hypothetical protein
MDDIHVRTSGGLIAVVWKDKREVYMLTNMDQPPPKGNFCDEKKKSLKPPIVDNRHIGSVSRSN